MKAASGQKSKKGQEKSSLIVPPACSWQREPGKSEEPGRGPRPMGRIVTARTGAALGAESWKPLGSIHDFFCVLLAADQRPQILDTWGWSHGQGAVATAELGLARGTGGAQQRHQWKGVSPPGPSKQSCSNPSVASKTGSRFGCRPRSPARFPHLRGPRGHGQRSDPRSRWGSGVEGTGGEEVSGRRRQGGNPPTWRGLNKRNRLHFTL